MSNKVLIVNNDSVNQGFLYSICKANGFDAIVATNTRDAIRIAKEEFPLLSIVSMRLKGSRGVDFINKIKIGLGLKTKIIVYSNDLDVFHDWKDSCYEPEMELKREGNASYAEINKYLLKLWTRKKKEIY